MPADPVQETAEAFVGTITGRMKASEPNLSPTPRDVPGSRAATVAEGAARLELSERPAPRRFAVSDVFSDQGIVVVTFDGEWPDPIKAAEAWLKFHGPRQFRVRELQADAPVRDFVFTPVRDAEGHYVADVVTEGPR